MPNRAGLVAATICCLASIVLVAPGASAACTGAGLSELAGRADGVFVGTVLREDDGVAEVRVSDVYRGDPGSVVRVDGGPPGGEDSSVLRPGTQYLVLAAGGGSAWRTSMCAGSGAVSDSRLATVEKVLGPATASRGAARSDATAPRSAAPSETEGPAAPAGEVEAARSNNGLQIAVGVVVAALLVGSFFLPLLRRRHRRRS